MMEIIMKNRELELKDIQCSLSCGLKCKMSDSDDVYIIWAVNVPYETVDIVSVGAMGGGVRGMLRDIPISDIKPLFNPMSALTQPMVVKGYNGGDEFIPEEVIISMFSTCATNFKWNKETKTFAYKVNRYYHFKALTFEVIEFMNMCYLDHQDLIGQGLALDKTKHL